jgi:hypothetical protein
MDERPGEAVLMDEGYIIGTPDSYLICRYLVFVLQHPIVEFLLVN